MFQITLSRRFNFKGNFRRIIRRYTSNVTSLLNETKKKKFSELTPQEIEVELKENLIRLRRSFDNDERENYVVPFFKKSLLYADQPAIKDSKGEYTYIQLYISAKRLAIQISNICSSASMKNIGYICANNVLSPLTQWACWISGQVAMPLNMCNSVEMLKYFLKDSRASALIVTPEFEQLGYELAEPLDISLVVIDHSFMVSPKTTLLSVPRVLIPSLDTVIVEGTCSNDFYTKANAMLLYTTGTTGKPKGVMITHRNLDAQVKSLTKAWKYDLNDCLMHALPLNHAHGFMNAFICPLNVGGRIIMQDHFDTKKVWSSLLGINMPVKERVNVFMAVPAVYNLLIAEYEKALTKNTKMVGYITNYCKENVRLMVSGGAPLPPRIFRRWREITGHNILECYGMTEFGLALSNPYVEDDQEDNVIRQPGFVGLPLPDVRVRLVDFNNKVLIDCMGEYSNDCWNVNFFDTNASKETHENVEQISSSQARAAEFLSKYFHIEKDEKSNSRNIFSYAAKRLTENIFYTFSMAGNILKSFQKSEKTDKSKETDTVNNANTDKSDKFKESITTIPRSIDTIFDTQTSENLLGELQVSGQHIFSAYFGNPEATRNAFCNDFFKTGDLATFQNGVFKILGRTNVNVIEIGCKQISSYDIESLILEHPNIRDVSVIAVPSQAHKTKDTITESESELKTKSNITLGVVCVLHQEAQLDLNSLNIFCAKSLPKYLLPTKLKIVDELPRSNLNEINREALLKLFEDTEVDSNRNTEQS